MKKLSLYVFLVLMFSSSVFADEYILSCTSDTQFLTVFSVNEEKKEIILLSSKSLISDQKFNNINRKMKIIYWKDKLVHTFSISNFGSHGFSTFDLINYNYIDTAHYINKLKDYSWSAYFKCIKI